MDDFEELRDTYLKNMGNISGVSRDLGISCYKVVKRLKSPRFSSVKGRVKKLKAETKDRRVRSAFTRKEVVRWRQINTPLRILGAERLMIEDGYPSDIVHATSGRKRGGLYSNMEVWEIGYYAKKAFRVKVKETHPDVNHNKNGDFQTYLQAYQFIKKVLNRRDRHLRL